MKQIYKQDEYPIVVSGKIAYKKNGIREDWQEWLGKVSAELKAKGCGVAICEMKTKKRLKTGYNITKHLCRTAGQDEIIWDFTEYVEKKIVKEL